MTTPLPDASKVPPGIARNSPKFRALLSSLDPQGRLELIAGGREREMWIYRAVLQYSPSIGKGTNSPTLVELAMIEGNVDILEYLIEFVSLGPVDDEKADPVRYQMLLRGLAEMRARGVVRNVEAYLACLRS